MFRSLVALVLSFSFLILPPQLHAASGSGKTAQSSTSATRHHLANIVISGLAGAVLGLSTLSFYGRPQDRLSNIAVGFAIGVISGTLYTTYKAAVEPREFYSLKDPTQSELLLSNDLQSKFALALVSAPRTGLTFSF